MIQVDDDGFTIVSKQTSRVEWNSVSRIVAYKLDLLTVDLICVGFSTESDQFMIETTEEDDGWKQLVAAFEARFDVSEGWWSKVAFPAFETNWTILWERSG